MDDCKTVLFLQQVAAGGGNLAGIARSALGLIEDIQNTHLDALYLVYLQEIIEHIYQENGLPLLDHLRDGADCELCAALAARFPR